MVRGGDDGGWVMVMKMKKVASGSWERCLVSASGGAAASIRIDNNPEDPSFIGLERGDHATKQC